MAASCFPGLAAKGCFDFSPRSAWGTEETVGLPNSLRESGRSLSFKTSSDCLGQLVDFFERRATSWRYYHFGPVPRFILSGTPASTGRLISGRSEPLCFSQPARARPAQSGPGLCRRSSRRIVSRCAPLDLRQRVRLAAAQDDRVAAMRSAHVAMIAGRRRRT